MRIGLFEAASGGSLFLDELPSLSPALQAKVLKAIEEHRIRRLGGTREIPVDARVMAATNRDLKGLVAAGQFREDLFHRLDLYRIVIPPLRERGDDIVKLAELLMAQLCRRHRLAVKKISPSGRQRLLTWAWPGNVRELAHELERAIVFEDSEVLGFENLQTPIDPAKPLEQTDWLRPDFMFPAEGFKLEEAIGLLVRQALKQSGGNVSAAARLLGVSRDYLRYRLAGRKGEEGV
jgi:transcriptional regulator with PAS, ATPase and Fis domain